MAVGFRVILGSENSAFTGDQIALATSTFTPAATNGNTLATIGGATWRISGTLADGTVVTNQLMGGTFQTDASGTLYFVPDDPVLTISSAVVDTSPVYNGPPPISLGNGPDTYTGSNLPNNIIAGDGDDLIYGGGDRAGNDQDVLFGGNGNDRLYGQGGIDRLQGGAGNDYINGGFGGDIVDYSDATSSVVITLNSSQDFYPTSSGGRGNDTLNGIDGIIGGNFNDTLIGYDVEGIDPDGSIYTNYLDGGAGNDYLDGKQGSDNLFGGSGDDIVIGGVSDNTPNNLGGQRPVDYDDQIFGGSGNDRLYGDDTLGTDTRGGDDLIQGGAGNDTILAGYGNDVVYGGADRDSIDGGVGNDRLYGGADNDTILGGAGNDRLFGGTGSDTLDGGAGADFIDGGNYTGATPTDDDQADRLTGGDGFDTFVAGNNDTITDFNFAAGQNFNDGNENNNDLVDLSTHYNAANLAIYNAWAAANGRPQYATALGWMQGDQADGRLDDISVGHGFAKNFTFTIQNGGTAVAGRDLTTDNTRVVCFSAEALIRTVQGAQAAGALSVGDVVLTRDAGAQAIRWIGKVTLSGPELAATPALRPIRIAKGALGQGLPERDLVVSPQHRILVRSKIALRMFGTFEVLVAAKHLTALEGIDVADDLDSVTYVHFLLDAHQIVFANGAETESMFTGPEALKAVGNAARDEILSLFPELGQAEMDPARELVAGRRARSLASRHSEKGRPLLM